MTSHALPTCLCSTPLCIFSRSQTIAAIAVRKKTAESMRDNVVRALQHNTTLSSLNVSKLWKDASCTTGLESGKWPAIAVDPVTLLKAISLLMQDLRLDGIHTVTSRMCEYRDYWPTIQCCVGLDSWCVVWHATALTRWSRALAKTPRLSTLISVITTYAKAHQGQLRIQVSRSAHIMRYKSGMANWSQKHWKKK